MVCCICRWTCIAIRVCPDSLVSAGLRAPLHVCVSLCLYLFQHFLLHARLVPDLHVLWLCRFAKDDTSAFMHAGHTAQAQVHGREPFLKTWW